MLGQVNARDRREKGTHSHTPSKCSWASHHRTATAIAAATATATVNTSTTAAATGITTMSL